MHWVGREDRCSEIEEVFTEEALSRWHSPPLPRPSEQTQTAPEEKKKRMKCKRLSRFVARLEYHLEMTDSWGLLLLHISWPCLGLATISSRIAPWAFNPKHTHSRHQIDPIRCVLKCSLCVCFIVKPTQGYPKGTDWCLPRGPAALYSSALPRLQATGSPRREKGT